MITDAEIADLCADIYSPSPVPLTWMHYDSGNDSDGVCWAIHDTDDASVVVFRGSATTLDWLRDLDFWADPFHHDDLGPVHPGFLSGIRTVQRELSGLVPHGRPIIVAGHSLGAARATVLAGLMTVDGLLPIARVTFGEPKPGFHQLSDILSPVPGRSYRTGDSNGHDLVTDVPFSVPPEQYMHPGTMILVTAAPGPIIMSWGMFAYHHVSLYADALNRPNRPENL